MQMSPLVDQKWWIIGRKILFIRSLTSRSLCVKKSRFLSFVANKNLDYLSRYLLVDCQKYEFAVSISFVIVNLLRFVRKKCAVSLCFSFFHRKHNRYRKRNRSKLSSMEREEKVPRRFWEREKNPKSIGITFFFPSSLLQTDTQIVRQCDLGLAQQISSHW